MTNPNGTTGHELADVLDTYSTRTGTRFVGVCSCGAQTEPVEFVWQAQRANAEHIAESEARA